MRNVPRQTIVPHWASNIAKTKTSEGNSAMLPVILVMNLSVKREELKKKALHGIRFHERWPCDYQPECSALSTELPSHIGRWLIVSSSADM